MAEQKKRKTGIRNKYPPEFRQEALVLAEKVGVPAAASELGLSKSQLYKWRSQARAQQSQYETEHKQAAEIAALKCKLAEQEGEPAIPKKAVTCFARSQGRSTNLRRNITLPQSHRGYCSPG